MQYGMELLTPYQDVSPMSRASEAFYVPRVYNHSPDDSEPYSGGGGGSYRLQHVNPRKLEGDYGSLRDDTPYMPGRDNFYQSTPMFNVPPENENFSAGLYNTQLYPAQYDPGNQRHGMDIPNVGIPPYHGEGSVNSTQRPNKLAGPSSTRFPFGRVDPGDYLRNKFHIPHHMPVNLYGLSEPTDGQRPSHALPTLVALAIYGSSKKMLTLQEIYAAIAERFEWYRINKSEKSWKNSIRHNLSLNLWFRKINRPITEPGKGSYWYVDITDGEGNKRVRKRKNRGSRISAGDPDEDDSDDAASYDDEHDSTLDNIDPSLRSESNLGPRRLSPRRRTTPSRQGSSSSSGPSRPQFSHAHTTPPHHLTPNLYGSYMGSPGFNPLALAPQNIPDSSFGHPSFPPLPAGSLSSVYTARR